MRFVLILAIASALAGCKTDSTEPADEDRSVFENHEWMHMLEDVRANRWAEGHARMVSLYRSAHGVEAFKRAMSGNPLVANHTGAHTSSFGACDGQDRGLCAFGAIETSVGNVEFEVHYVIEDSQEKLVAFAVAGVPIVAVGLTNDDVAAPPRSDPAPVDPGSRPPPTPTTPTPTPTPQGE